MDQTAVIGSRVTLPCRVLDQKGPIQWTKDDFGLGAVRNLTGYERYAMIGSDEEGKWNSWYYSMEKNTKEMKESTLIVRRLHTSFSLSE